MGTWGTAVFENDDAVDWAGDLAEGGTAQNVTDALTFAASFPTSEYLDAPEGNEALAAAEVVAAAHGRPTESTSYSEGALNWAGANQGIDDESTRELARAAVSRVGGDQSELAEIWDEAGEEAAGQWRTVLAGLLERLSD